MCLIENLAVILGVDFGEEKITMIKMDLLTKVERDRLREGI